MFELRKRFRSLVVLLPFSLLTALIFTLLTQDLSPKCFTTISISATGVKNQNSKAAVVWLTDPDIAELQRKNFHMNKSKGWETHNGILISTRNQPAELLLEGYLPGTARLEFSETPYSGHIELEVNGIKKNVDLFRDHLSTAIIPLNDSLLLRNNSVLPVIFSFLTVFTGNALLLIVLSIAIYPIYLRFPSPAFVPLNGKSGAAIRSRQKYAVLLAVFIFGLLLWGFYPGVMTDDSVDQYAQAVRFQFNDWHPPIMATLWSLTNRIIEGPGGMFLVHLAMLISSAYFLSIAALIKGKKHFLTPLLAIFLPMVLCISYYIIKDVSLAFSLLLAISLWSYWRASGKLNRARLLWLLLIVFYASSVRLNALPAVLPLLFLFLVDFTSKRTALLCSLILGAIFYLGNHYINYRILGATKSHTLQVIMAHNLMAIYDITQQNYFPQSYLERNRLDELMTQFKQEDSNATTWIEKPFLSTDPAAVEELRKNWVDAIWGQPAAYLAHRWVVFRNFILYLDPWIFNYHKPDSLHSEVPLLVRRTTAGEIYRSVGIWIRDHLSFLFVCMTYLILHILMLSVAIKKKNLVVGVLSFSALIYLAAYIFFAPGADYRYNYWPVIAFLLCIFEVWKQGSAGRITSRST